MARQIEVIRQIKAGEGATAPNGSRWLSIQLSAVNFFQHVAQAAVRKYGWTDMIGLGRMILSYPTLPADSLEKGALTAKSICRTFSDCTTAPRNGMISGCYPLDKFYAAKPGSRKGQSVEKSGCQLNCEFSPTVANIQVFDQASDGFVHGKLVSPQLNLRLLRCFVRRGDAGVIP